MKNLFVGLILTVTLFSSNVNAKNIENLKSENYETGLGRKHIEGSLTLSGGCNVHYSVDIVYTIIPPSISSIHGSVTMSGPCSGTQTFKASAKTDKDGIISDVQTDLTDKNLQTKEFNDAFAKSLNEAKIFSE